MAKAFQKVYTKISQITKATCSLKAKGVGYDELATINGKLAQVVKIAGDDITLQVFEGTGGTELGDHVFDLFDYGCPGLILDFCIDN